MKARSQGSLVRSSRTTAATRCPYCHDAVAPEHDDAVECIRCGAFEHRACWRENRGCSSCRASLVLHRRCVRPLDLERVAVWWGVAALALVVVIGFDCPRRVRDRLRFGGSDVLGADIVAQQDRREAEATRVREERAREASDGERLRLEDERHRRLAEELAEQDHAKSLERQGSSSYWEKSRFERHATGSPSLDAEQELEQAQRELERQTQARRWEVEHPGGDPRRP